MSLIQVDGNGRLANVGVEGTSSDYGVEYVSANGAGRNIRITGTHPSGCLAVNGGSNEITGVDISTFGTSPGVVVPGNNNRIAATVNGGGSAAVISGHQNEVSITAVNPDGGAVVSGNRNQVKVGINTADNNGVEVTGDFNKIRGSVFASGQHGVYVEGDNNDFDVVVEQSGGDTNNTYDNVHFGGAAARNHLKPGSVLRPRTSGNNTRSGVYHGATTVRNRVIDVDLGVPATYGTDAYTDAGDNDNTLPAHATYGDNWIT